MKISYTLCRRCCENAIAAEEGKGILTAGKQAVLAGLEAILRLSRLDCPSAKTGETVNGGAVRRRSS